MSEEGRAAVSVDLHVKSNNSDHRTGDISVDELVVRRGQAFNVSLNGASDAEPLAFSARTGQYPSESRGTLSNFSLRDGASSARAKWRAELQRGSSTRDGTVNLSITPPADAPVGRYTLTAKVKNEEMVLGSLVVLFNPWCPEDSVFLPDEREKQEYVMNEQGIIYTGSGNYIGATTWDYGQFEDNMLEICLRILDMNHKHRSDPAADVAARSSPIYVGRAVSAMVNVQDDGGVVVGRWKDTFPGGVAPTHWTGSHAILKKWYQTSSPVKYGQCWVFAGVMCSVMRLLGIPCRVVSNFQSAHDTDRNLTIDVFHTDDGVRERKHPDSIWNFHVWTEAWMTRPDLASSGNYNGWQVLDPTPQEMSGGIYCCGPASVKAIRDGETNLKYDIPFIFAEVNADCVDWLIKSDGSKVKISTDSKRVGQSISTKAVGSNRRVDITSTYKYREGSDKERSVFKYANTRDYSRVDRPEEDPYMVNARSAAPPPPRMARVASVEARAAAREENVDSASSAPPMYLQFEEVSQPVNGADVSLKLLVQSRSSDARPLSINISVQAMRYNGAPAGKIQSEVTEQTLEPGKELSVPVLVQFSAYGKLMRNSESMKIAAIVTDKQNPDQVYMAESDVVLLNPSISVTVSGPVKLNQESSGQVSFLNPLDETLRNCTLTLSGGGVWKQDVELTFQDLSPGKRLQTGFSFTPYKTGQKTIVATLDCSAFRDIKGSCTIDVKP